MAVDVVQEEWHPSHITARTAQAISDDIRRQVDADPELAALEAQRCYREFREQRYEARRHQRRARRAIFRAKTFQRDLEALGITVIFELGPRERARQLNATEGGDSDNQAAQAT
jgi:hypothetical protein